MMKLTHSIGEIASLRSQIRTTIFISFVEGTLASVLVEINARLCEEGTTEANLLKKREQ